MDDYISRKEAIWALTQSSDYIADALERLEKVPAADVVPREDYMRVCDILNNVEEALRNG